MNNLQKFESTLAEFDNEVSKLKSIGEVHQEIKKLANDYEIVVSKIQESNKSLHSVLKQHQDFQNEIKKNITEIEKQYSKNKSDIQSLLTTKLDEIKQQNKVFENSLTEIVENLRKENKQFYRDFEETVRIKLAENKSEIKQLIEQETIKLKDIFTTELDKRTSEIIKRQKSLLKTIWLSSGTIILALILIIYILLKQ
jgi:hypothetical protein